MHGDGNKMSTKQRISGCIKYIKTFGKWLFCAVAVGLACGICSIAFAYAMQQSATAFVAYDWLLYLLPLFGILIVASYRLARLNQDSNTNLIFETIRSGDKLSLLIIPMVFLGTCLTHLGGGSAGREGAALQIGGSLGAGIGRLVHLNDKDIRIITICGMSAAFSALFGTPLTAALFCIEVISVGIFYYAALIPCIIAAITANMLVKACGVPTFDLIKTFAYSPLSLVLIGKILILAALCALVSILFCSSLHKTNSLYQKHVANPYIRIIIGSALVILSTKLIGNNDYNGIGWAVVVNALNGNAVSYAFLLKILLTALTLGAGFKGGEIIPSLFVGATFGCWAGGLLGIDPGFAAAIGLIAVFCGVVNCPIASIILSVELFGSGNLLYFALACAVAYMLSGRYSLYSAQKIVYSKLEATYIDAKTQ